MRIERPETTDEPDGARMCHRARSAFDDPDTAARDQGKVNASDSSRGPTPGSLDSALRIERAVAYRVAVDVAYEQHAIARGNAKAETPEREAATPTVRRNEVEGQERRPLGLENHLLDKDEPPLVRNTNRPGYPTAGTALDDVLTGARGPASRRDFNPEAAGGPIRQLDAAETTITNEGVQEVTSHLHRFTGGGSLEAPEQAMLDRLTSIASGDMQPTSYDQNFYTHELDEAGRYAQLGYGPESGADLGSSEMYDVWNDVHTAALEDYGISDADLFQPGLAP